MSTSSTPQRDDETTPASGFTVRGKFIPTVERQISHTDLRYFADNPRVYSMVQRGDDEPTQEEIEAELQGMEHVRELIQDIRRNGGLIEPLIVKDKTLEVIEGNSRLAAWRRLAVQDPVKWAGVKCLVLPATVEQTVISALLGQWHLKGKKEWVPYEQAGYLWRRHKKDGIAIPDLALEVLLSHNKVRELVNAYDFMAKHSDAKRDRFSYYFEYTRSARIAKARKKFDKLDAIVVQQIKADRIVRAQDLRQMLPVVCNKEKVLRSYVQRELSLEEAFGRAESEGGGHKPSRKLKDFRNWLALPGIQKELVESQGNIRKEIVYEVGKLRTQFERLFKKLDE